MLFWQRRAATATAAQRRMIFDTRTGSFGDRAVILSRTRPAWACARFVTRLRRPIIGVVIGGF